MLVVVDPPFVQYGVQLRLADGFHLYVHPCAVCLLDGDVNCLASLSVKHPVVVLASLDVVAVNLLDDAPRLNARVLDGKGTTAYDLLYEQSVAVIGGVEE